VDDVPHRWRGTVPGGGARRGFLALSTSAHHLAAAHAEGLVTAQPSVKGCARRRVTGASRAVVSSHRTDHPAHELPKYFVKNALGEICIKTEIFRS